MKVGRIVGLKVGRFRLGLRTIKTGCAIMFILIFFQVTHRAPEGAMVAGTSAVVAVRGGLKDTVSVARARFFGAGLGGAFSIIYFLLYTHSGHNFFVKMLIVPLFIMSIIVIMDGLNLNTGLIGSCASFLIISLGTPEGETLTYVIDRIIDTFIGVGFAVIVNSVGSPDTPIRIKKKNKIAQPMDYKIDKNEDDD